MPQSLHFLISEFRKALVEEADARIVHNYLESTDGTEVLQSKLCGRCPGEDCQRPEEWVHATKLALVQCLLRWCSGLGSRVFSGHSGSINRTSLCQSSG